MRSPNRLILTLLTPAALLSTIEPSGLAELARKADRRTGAGADTDYLRRQEELISGSAYLRVLIP
jgi:hypothetical protein